MALLRRVRLVDRHDNRAGGKRRKTRVGPLRPRVRQDRNPVSRLDAQIDEPKRQLPHRAVELLVGDLDPLATNLVPERRLAAVPCRRQRDQISHRPRARANPPRHPFAPFSFTQAGDSMEGRRPARDDMQRGDVPPPPPPHEADCLDGRGGQALTLLPCRSRGFTHGSHSVSPPPVTDDHELHHGTRSTQISAWARPLAPGNPGASASRPAQSTCVTCPAGSRCAAPGRAPRGPQCLRPPTRGIDRAAVAMVIRQGVGHPRRPERLGSLTWGRPGACPRPGGR